MRCTLGTVTASAVALLVASAFWPQEAPPVAGGPVAARAEEARGTGGPEAKRAEDTVPVAGPYESEQDRALRQKLADTPHECEYLDTPLVDALTDFSLRLEIDVYAPKSQFAEFLDKPITFHVQHAKISARAALELVLGQAGLGYVIRDGMVMICQPGALTEIRIYDTATLNLPESVDSINWLGGFGGAGEPGKAAEPEKIKLRGVEALAELIPGIIRPDAWTENGGTEADLRMLGERLIVRSTPAIHREIESLLSQIGKKQPATAH